MIWIKSKKSVIILCITIFFLFTGCNMQGSTNDSTKEKSYMNITAHDAKKIMDTETGYVILDVRTLEEYNDGHIVNAILIPDYEINEKAESLLKDKNQLILVYCRSGRRSKNAAQELVNMGYTNIKEFGGIIDWPYEIQK